MCQHQFSFQSINYSDTRASMPGIRHGGVVPFARVRCILELYISLHSPVLVVCWHLGYSASVALPQKIQLSTLITNAIRIETMKFGGHSLSLSLNLSFSLLVCNYTTIL